MAISNLPVSLPAVVWRTVRASLRFQLAKLERRAGRGTPNTEAANGHRWDNLTRALAEVERVIRESEQEEDEVNRENRV